MVNNNTAKSGGRSRGGTVASRRQTARAQLPQDLHRDLKADSVPVRMGIANPAFNMSDWPHRGGMRQDVCWKLRLPPVNNSNYGREVRNEMLNPDLGVAGFVMAKITRSAHSRSMKITQDVLKYAAEQGGAKQEELTRKWKTSRRNSWKKAQWFTRECKQA